ncbi:NAD(P)-binding protein [Penicillium waksmanii]|uniref:NAD(P)-binding protein n=1 Tax=Penicillium waksmanii TaxID=69791 RepID=UPI002548BE2B|nr:NAD(P)-binding protein [Penicillium waksmanii]KAJ5974106.1 NAD(P)-binding protein [Penicillium waksmanii]
MPLKLEQLVLFQGNAKTIITPSSNEKLGYVKAKYGVHYTVNYKEKKKSAQVILPKIHFDPADSIFIPANRT